MRETAEPPKETIIVVHGTWAAPAAKELRWWQPVGDSHVSEGFVAKLDAELRQRGSTARCWAHCKDGSEIFHWSGENNWVDRAKASSAFRTYLHKLQSDGWTCHIVAHSHGGNVVLDTLSSQATQQLVPPGKLVTIGCPFLDVMPPIFRKSKFIMTLMGWTAFIVSLLVFVSVSYLMIDVIDSSVIQRQRLRKGLD